MENLVSVVIPIYNVEKYLKICLDSIINQTYSNLEIILINDGSFDNSGYICDEYAKKDDRIIVIHKENEGVSAARNCGIEKATGKYITFVDSDDFVSLDHIEYLYSLLSEDNSDMAVCGYHFYTKNYFDSYLSCEKNLFDAKDVLKNMFSSNSVEGYCWNKLFHTKKVKNISFDKNIKICEDLDFIIEYLKLTKTVSVGRKKCYFYRQRKSSALNVFNYKNLTVFNILNKMYDDYDDDLNFKRFYFKFYLKYRKYLKETNIEIKYNFKKNAIIFNKDLDFKLKILYYIYKILPIRIINYLILFKQCVKKYFE